MRPSTRLVAAALGETLEADRGRQPGHRTCMNLASSWAFSQRPWKSSKTSSRRRQRRRSWHPTSGMQRRPGSGSRQSCGRWEKRLASVGSWVRLWGQGALSSLSAPECAVQWAWRLVPRCLPGSKLLTIPLCHHPQGVCPVCRCRLWTHKRTGLSRGTGPGGVDEDIAEAAYPLSACLP